MITKIQGEQPFQVLATNFSISPSEQDYTLQVSADGENFSDLFTVSAGQTKMVTNVANGSYYRLKNNNSLVEVNWRTQCNDGQGGGGGGTGPQGPQGPQGPAGAGDSGQVQTMIDNSLASFSQSLQDGEPIVGMAAQLYSPDGVTSEGTYAYRTTAGDADVATGDAELRVLKGNSDYSNVQTSYDASAVLMRNGEEVTGFTCSLTTQEINEWIAIGDADVSEIMPQAIRIGTPIRSGNGNEQFDYYHYRFNGTTDGFVPIRVFLNHNVEVWDSSHCTAVTTNQSYVWLYNGLSGTVEVDWTTEFITFTITGGTGYCSNVYTYNNDINIQVLSRTENDLELGEHSYTYGDNAWSPELPLAISNMQIDGVAYSPETYDEIIITENMLVTGEAVYPSPSEFVALGLNSFDYTCEGVLSSKEEGLRVFYDSTYAITNYSNYEDNENYTTFYVKAVTGLADGYVLHSPNGVLTERAGVVDIPDFYHSENPNYGGTVEVEANKTYVVYPTTAMPYIIFSVLNGDETDVCVHPRWSGKQDEGFEEYSESLIDLSNLSQYPLYSLGDYRNELDLKNGVFKEYVTAEPFDADTLNDYLENGYTLGVDIAYDENYIYIANNEPTEIDISEYVVSPEYNDNDFSVEYFVAYGDEDNTIILPQPVYAENFYITNLVDKLRRLDVDFIHLDSIETEGKVGKTYEYQGRLMQWVEGSGYTAEWLRPINELGSDEGEGLIYSTIPEGQILFEMYYSSYTHRNVVYRNQTLYLMEGDNVISSATVGSSFKFECNGISSRFIQGRFVNGHIGFYKASTTVLTNVWDGKANGSHYELIDKYNYPYSNPNQGIPVWNSKGQVIGLNYGSINTKTIYINATGTSTNNRLNVVTSSFNNGPDRWFAPVTGGAQGQTLVSAGDNAAPTWETRIKVVKITSDAYEALVQAGTTDPNTLYAIVDE